ncbi:MAG: hypothetical protein H8D63_01855 [Parcubacteria group bacterium]|nr:hypothetical protein [Parcubacteria group bacterium]
MSTNDKTRFFLPVECLGKSMQGEFPKGTFLCFKSSSGSIAGAVAEANRWRFECTATNSNAEGSHIAMSRDGVNSGITDTARGCQFLKEEDVDMVPDVEGVWRRARTSGTSSASAGTAIAGATG